ncbi:hypothetical protein [uncultured Desulfuromusa sp.]|uniref:hypothetical protein n=1 Tax=uncultured Desulfuromusa sp. TaxID=219183 RepID=UPI002AA7B9F2|nr:hypothetical protein [uncultured Desulfuromusa sp.]
MKKLVYMEGPLKVKMGAAGTFKRGEPKDVADDKLADKLLKKKVLRFYEDGKVPAEALKRGKALEAAEAKAKQPKKKEA